MRGHIAKKGKRYYTVIHMGPDPATGKPKYRWETAGTNRKEAEKILAERIKRVHDGQYQALDNTTLGDYLLSARLPSIQTRLKPSATRSYERNILLHINPNIGRIPLQKLRPEDLDKLYAQLLTSGKRNGNKGGLSPQSVRNVHITIQSALSDATRKGTVLRNVADLADAPSTSRTGRSMNVWTSSELRSFLESIADHYLYRLYLLAATTGMRRAEVAGLKWRNVDLDAARLTVNEQLLSVQYQLINSTLKTSTSRRNIDLDPTTVKELQQHRHDQLETRLSKNERDNEGYVFAKVDGSPIHPDLISQTFQRLVAKLDLPRIRLHDLRHTHATILLQQGCNPKVVSERLGHASVSFTMDVYQHILPGMQAKAAAQFEAEVFGET